MNGRKEKIVYLEILRVIAIFGVLFCHTGYYGAHHYLTAESGLNYWLGIFLVSIMQYCIPVFFMISGALLLNREETIAYVLRHRVLKMVIVIFLASFVQYFWNYHKNPLIGFDLKTYFRVVYEGGASSPIWFLYTYTSFLLVLPFVQKMVKSIQNPNWFLYLFLLYNIGTGILPIVEYYQKWDKPLFELPLFAGCIVFVCMGYYIVHCSEDVFYKGKNIAILFVVCLMAISTTMYMNHITIPEKQIANYGEMFCSVYALFLFVFVRYICHRREMSKILEKTFRFLGAGVFGTYLLEGILRDCLEPIYIVLNTKIYSYPATFVWILACVIVGILVSNVIKRIPYVGKLL